MYWIPGEAEKGGNGWRERGRERGRGRERE